MGLCGNLAWFYDELNWNTFKMMVNCLLVGIALFVMNRPEAKNAMSKNFLRLVRVPSSLLCISVKVGAIPSLFCRFKGSLTFSSSTLFSLNISIYILHAPLCTFPLVLTSKICLTINRASQVGDHFLLFS